MNDSLSEQELGKLDGIYAFRRSELPGCVSSIRSKRSVILNAHFFGHFLEGHAEVKPEIEENFLPFGQIELACFVHSITPASTARESRVMGEAPLVASEHRHPAC
jgi:hypothetical protein